MPAIHCVTAPLTTELHWLGNQSESYLSSQSQDSSNPSQESSDTSQESYDPSQDLPNTYQSSLYSPNENVRIMVDSLYCIKSLSRKDPEAIDSKVRDFFDATFEVCTSNVELTKEEQDWIGPLIKYAIPDMDDCLMDMGTDFDADYAPEALVIRSGYQFMIDNFKEFPDGNSSTLESGFKYFKNTGSIDILDGSLSRWKKQPYICEEDVQHTGEEINKPAKVPDFHHWWFQST